VRPMANDGQAHTVDRDAFAQAGIGEWEGSGIQAQAGVAASWLAHGQPADALDDAGGHQRAPRRCAPGRSWNSKYWIMKRFPRESQRKTPQGKGTRGPPQRGAGRLLSSGL